MSLKTIDSQVVKSKRSLKYLPRRTLSRKVLPIRKEKHTFIKHIFIFYIIQGTNRDEKDIVPNSEATQFRKKTVPPTDQSKTCKFYTKKLEQRLREGFSFETT